MNNDSRRFIIFIVASALLMLLTQALLDKLGLLPKPRPRVPEPPEVSREIDEEALAQVRAFADDANSPTAFAPAVEAPGAPEAPVAAITAAPGRQVPEVPPDALVLGEADPKAVPGLDYHMRAELTQRGAGLRRLKLAKHEAELPDRRKPAERLAIIDANPTRFRDSPGPPLALSLHIPGVGNRAAQEIPLAEELWEVVPDAQGRLVRAVAADPSKSLLDGQAVVFRTEVPKLGLTVTKTITLRRGRDALDLALSFESQASRSFSYSLQGPYGIPVDGEWFTSTFRELFFGKMNGSTTEIETRPANEVVERAQKGDPIRATSMPLKYTGIENQYFAVFLEPEPLPAKPEDRWDEKAVGTVIESVEPKHKSEISVVIDSKTFEATPRAPLEHHYLLFAGAKTTDTLAAFGAEELASYRKGWQLPIIGGVAMWLARTVISPMLDQIYGLTASVGKALGGLPGSYGIAIILLTVAVRLMMFPLSRKQARSAKRMQDMQPQLLALRTQYGEDKERIAKETWALYKTNGINPFGGCLVAIIQLPIFLGLWQALNNSVRLRHAGFLWIRNLAAPDQLFKFPFEIPFIGAWLGPYFNVLPIIVIVLMLVQTKLFSPPATTPEMKQQQSIMKWMFGFMMFMFYKVPSGLGVYFIVSSLWSICERVLLPVGALPSPNQEPATTEMIASSPKTPQRGGGNGKPPGWRERLRERIEQVMEEAEHDKTARNTPRDRPRENAPKRRPRRPPGRR